ncbi:MAG TPA: SCP2 sterol-binding domain-containing protein [Anaerolineaceae bacterium]|jgi:putative sterol carrier protein|nr:SCP2 sterol-binding domain-containing protein [Anaerolineaceae bacterium]
MSEQTIQDWLDKVPEHFIPEKAAGVDATVQFRLTGNQAGEYYVVIRDQKVRVEKGVAPNPKVTLAADSNDILQILSGKMDGMRAFMQGKLKVNGDMGFATKMLNMFKP